MSITSMQQSLSGLEQDPSFLNNAEPMEVEDIPLQVALLTMEVKRLRDIIDALPVTQSVQVVGDGHG